jgi:hypothetical protein
MILQTDLPLWHLQYGHRKDNEQDPALHPQLATLAQKKGIATKRGQNVVTMRRGQNHLKVTMWKDEIPEVVVRGQGHHSDTGGSAETAIASACHLVHDTPRCHHHLAHTVPPSAVRAEALLLPQGN